MLEGRAGKVLDWEECCGGRRSAELGGSMLKVVAGSPIAFEGSLCGKDFLITCMFCGCIVVLVHFSGTFLVHLGATNGSYIFSLRLERVRGPDVSINRACSAEKSAQCDASETREKPKSRT
jgi:hypothetical protein